ncbi:hypothetical protein TNCV_477531 [Trichonephila clavipes]|nr:hypothetical protein TNCV_477531 [Trichonephila clavipes]
MNKIWKTPSRLDYPTVFIAAGADNVSTALIMADKDILEFDKSSKNIIYADSDDENEMNNASPRARDYHVIRNKELHEKVREHRDWSLEDSIRVAWSAETRFQLLNTKGRLRIWLQAHAVMNPANKVGTVQGHDLGCFFVALFGIFSTSTNLPQCNSIRKVSG